MSASGVAAPARRIRVFLSPWPWVGLGVCLVLTLVAWLQVRRIEQTRLAALEKAQSSAVVMRVERRMVNLAQVLRGAAGYLGRGSLPTRAEWHAYVDSLDLPSTYPGLQGLSFVEWIPAKDLAAHVQRLRREGFPDYAVLPGGALGPAEEGSSSILYVEPVNARNQRAVGKDMLRDAVRRDAMLQARDTGQVVLSGRLTLYQETEVDAQPGVVLYAPVYRLDLPTDTVEARRRALRGWATIPLRMDDFMAATLTQDRYQFNLELFDGPQASAERRLFDSSTAHAARDGQIRVIAVAGRVWTLRVEPSPAFFREIGRARHWQFLAGGLAISLLIFTILVIQQGAEARARRLAEARGRELLATEAQFRALFESAPFGMAIVDSASGCFLSVNARLGDILGYAPSDLETRTFQSVTHPDHLAADLDSVRDLVSGSHEIHEVRKEKRYLHQDGHEVWGRLSMVRLPSLPGEPGRHLSIVEDITKARARGEEIKASEARFRGIFDLSHDPITLSRLSDGKLVMANQAWCEATGIPLDEALGHAPVELGTWRQPEERAVLLAELRREGRIAARPSVIRRRDGRERQVLITAQVLTIGQEELVLIMGKDVTEQHQTQVALQSSEARYRGLFDLSPDPITLSRLADGVLVMASQSWCEATGIPLAEALGHSFDDLGDWSPPQERKALMEELGRKGQIVAWPSKLCHRDGRERQVLITAQILTIGQEELVLIMGKDVTEQHQTQVALQESEARFRSYFDLSPDAITVSRMSDGVLLLANPAWSELTGFQTEEAMGKSVMELGLWVQPEQRPSLLTELNTAGRIHGVENNLRRKDGTVRMIQGSMQLLEFGGEEVALSITKDVTEKHRTQVALQESEARYHGLFDHSPDGILLIRRHDQVLLEVNQAWERMTGVPRAEALGKTTLELGLYLDTAQRTVVYENLPSSGPSKVFPMSLVRRGGGAYEAEVTANALEVDGEGLVLVVLRDVSERMQAEAALRASEAQFRSVVADSPVAIFLHREGRVSFANAAALRLLRADSPGELLTKTPQDLVHPDDLELVRQRIQRDFDEGQPNAPLEHRLVALDGTIVEAEVQACPVTYSGQTHLMVFAQEIGERKRMLEALKQSAADLAQAQEIGNFGSWRVVYAPEGETWTCSEGLRRIYGYAPGQAITLESGFNVMHPEDRAPAAAAWQAAMEGTGPFAWEHRILVDGQVRWLAITVQFRHAEDGGLLAASGIVQDITERKQAEATLQASEARWKLALEAAGDGMWEWTEGASDVYYSPRYKAMLGYGADDDFGSSFMEWTERIHPEERAAVLVEANAYLDGKRADYVTEHRLRRRDGSYLWVLVRGAALEWDAAGRPTRVIGTITDVTARKETELALAQSEARLRILGDQLPDSFLYQLVSDLDGRSRFVYFSAGVERLCGLKAADVLADPDLLFNQMDAPTLQRYLAEEVACAKALRPFAMDLHMRRADGHWRWLRVRSKPCCQIDGSLLWEGIATDVTAEKMGRLALAESEARFRQLADTAPALIWMSDTAGSCTYFNQGWTAWTGRSVEEAQGEGCLGFIHPEDLPGCLAISDRAFQAREPYTVEFRLRHRSGAYRWVSDHAHPRFAEDGAFLGYIGAGIDIQEMKEAEATSRDSELRARKAESLVLMAGGIAHDFNNIFQGTLGFLDIAGAKASEDAGLSLILGKAKASLRKAIQLSWKMLDFSGRGLLKTEPIDLERWLPAFLATLQLDLPPTVQVLLSADPVPTIQGDRFKLEEVVKAMVDNAIEAFGPGGGRINLRLRADFREDRIAPGSPGVWPLQRPAGPASVCIECADDGPGVPPALLSLICDPFFTTREQGRGLGLAVVVGILGAHRAGFHLFNGEGGGLVQRIHFPPSGV